MLNKSILALDLDDTLVETRKLLLEKGYSLETEEKLVEAYIREADNLIHAEPKHEVLNVIKSLEPFFDMKLVITARVSVPAEITCGQVREILGKEYHVFFTPEKGKLLNSLRPNAVFVVDDVLDHYRSLDSGFPSLLVTPQKISSVAKNPEKLSEFLGHVIRTLRLEG